MKDRKPSVLQSMGSQRFRHDLATEQQQQQAKHACPSLTHTHLEPQELIFTRFENLVH